MTQEQNKENNKARTDIKKVNIENADAEKADKQTIDKQSKKENSGITEGIIWQQLLLFFFPLLFGTFFQMLYNMADALIVGRFVGTTALSAVGGTPAVLINLLVGILVGLSSGATVVVAQSYGAARYGEVERAVHSAMAVGIVVGFLFMVLCIWLGGGMLTLLGTPRETYDESLLYLTIYALGMIPNTIYNMAAGILRAAGDSKRPLYFLVASTLTNIVLDLFFILGLHMGVAGAALATILSQLVSAVLGCITLMRTKESYRLEIRRIRFDPIFTGKVLRIGIPAALQSTTYSLSNLFVQAAVNGFGTAMVAAWTINDKVDSLFWMIIASFGTATMTFAGQNYGAGKLDRVRSCVRQSLIITAIFTLGMMAIILTMGQALCQVFSSDPEVISLGKHMIQFLTPTFLTYICIEVMGGTLRGMGDVVLPTVISILGVCVLRIGWVVFAVPRVHTIDTVMLGYPITWITTSVLFVVYYLYYVKKRHIGRKE